MLTGISPARSGGGLFRGDQSDGGAGSGAAAPAAVTGAGGRTVGRSARIFTHRRGPITDCQKMGGWDRKLLESIFCSFLKK